MSCVWNGQCCECYEMPVKLPYRMISHVFRATTSMHSSLPVLNELINRCLHNVVYIELCIVFHLRQQVADHGHSHDPKADPANLPRQINHAA